MQLGRVHSRVPALWCQAAHAPDCLLSLPGCRAGAVSSLRFALTHPLVEADEGMGPAAHHQELTEVGGAGRGMGV
jgi:hypothetical protein